MYKIVIFRLIVFFSFLITFSCNDNSSLLITDNTITIQYKLINELNKQPTILNIVRKSDSYSIFFSDNNSLLIYEDEIPLVTIGSNYNWFINNTDTGIKSNYSADVNPSIELNSKGNWSFNGLDSGFKTKTNNWIEPVFITVIVQLEDKVLFYFSDGTISSVITNSFYSRLSDGIFGVKINRNTPDVNEIERVFDSDGLVTFVQEEGSAVLRDDFTKVFPYSDMKICNVNPSLVGGQEIVYETDSGFSRNNDTFVEIPLFFMKRYIENGYEYRLISKTQKEGFFPAPMFVEGDKIIEKVYVGVYQTSLDNRGNARSVTGKIPLNGKKIGQYRQLHYAKGIGFSTVDVRTIMTLQHLYLIRFANKNSQETIGGGWTDLAQPIIKPITNAPSNVIVVNSSQVNVSKHWFIGQNVCTANVTQIKEYAVLTNILINTPVKGQTSFVLDRKLNLDGVLNFGASPQNTGWSDVLTHDTGRTKQNVLNANDEACSVKLFGIEDLWGNTWLMLDGLYYKGTTPYICYDSKKFDKLNEYIPTNFRCLEQSINTPYSGTFGFVENIGYDETLPWLSFPDAIGSKNVSGKRGYGDFYYQYNVSVDTYCVFGGGFDNYDRCGLFSFRGWNDIGYNWYLYGSRMQYKPI